VFYNAAELPAPPEQNTSAEIWQKRHGVDIRSKWLPQEFDRGKHSLCVKYTAVTA